MKRFNFLLAVIAIMLTVTIVGCTTMTGIDDGYYDGYPTRVYGNRVYVDDPYRGTIVLERDPRTGRYYEAGTYDPYYNGYYGHRYYGRTYGYGYGYQRSNSGNYRNNNNQNNQRPTEENSRSREEARDKVLGKHQ